MEGIRSAASSTNGDRQMVIAGLCKIMQIVSDAIWVFPALHGNCKHQAAL